LEEEHKFEEDEKTRKEVCGCFSQPPSPRKEGGYSSAAESIGAVSSDIDIYSINSSLSFFFSSVV
jgi:hypothetical protein